MIYVIMSIYHPNVDFLREQIESLSWQTHSDFELVVVIADTKSLSLVQSLIDKTDLTVSYVTPSHDLNAVQAFEAGLSKALHLSKEMPDCHFAFCDQDDVWFPERLEAGLKRLKAKGVDLVHSDSEMIDAKGQLLNGSTLRHEGRQKNPRLRDLLYRNSVTGMTMLFTRSLAEKALPFPKQSGVHFYHDLWLALLAKSMAGISFIDAPLVQYRQHNKNAVGAIERAKPKLRLPKLRGFWNVSRLRKQAAAHGLARFLAHEVVYRNFANSGETEPKLGTLHPFFRSVFGPLTFLTDGLRLAFCGYFGQSLTAFRFSLIALGRLVWSIRSVTTVGLPKALKTFDQKLFQLAPGVVPQSSKANLPKKSYEIYQDNRVIPKWKPSFTANEKAINVLVPTLNPSEFYAGIITALDFGLGLATHGHKVRFIATDLPISSVTLSESFLKNRLFEKSNGSDAIENISIFCSLANDFIPSHTQDRFFATAWWTAHIADNLIQTHPYTRMRFYYLIQDFEPNFYAWGREYADSSASYSLNFEPIFNTNTLQKYFAQQGYQFASEHSLAFHPSIDLSRYQTGQRPNRQNKPIRLALYGRPAVARNMFSTAVEALSLFLVQNNIQLDEVELISVGQFHETVNLPNGHQLKSQGKLSLDEYPEFLKTIDIGLSLMFSPHPSHPPLEMAASGIRVVTNRFGTKDLSALTPSIISGEASPSSMARALGRAWNRRHEPVANIARDIKLTELGLAPDDAILALSQQLDLRYPVAAE